MVQVAGLVIGLLIATLVSRDARRLGAQRGRLGGGLLDMGPVGWFFTSWLLGLIGWLCYAIARRRLKARAVAPLPPPPAYDAWQRQVTYGYGAGAYAPALPTWGSQPPATHPGAAPAAAYPGPVPAAPVPASGQTGTDRFHELVDTDYDWRRQSNA